MGRCLLSLTIVLSMLALLSCEAKHTPAQRAAGTPSSEVYHALQLFLAADTLNQHAKFHAVFLQQDSLAGDLLLYALDVYNSTGDIKAFPLTTWQVDQKPIFVFTGLETIASGGDTTHHHLIRETEAANKGRIWSPDLRCWRIQVHDQKVTRIDKNVFFYPFAPSAPPPPLPKLNN